MCDVKILMMKSNKHTRSISKNASGTRKKNANTDFQQRSKERLVYKNIQRTTQKKNFQIVKDAQQLLKQIWSRNQSGSSTTRDFSSRTCRNPARLTDPRHTKNVSKARKAIRRKKVTT